MKSARTLAIFALILSFTAAPAAAAEIAPHEAVYRLTLKDLRIEGWSDTAGGILQMKVSRDCNFWMLDRKLEFEIEFTDGRRTHIILNEKFRESLDGERFWFWSRTTVNGGTASIISGEAARLITLKPEKKEVVEKTEKKEDEGPSLEDLVATPEELAKKAAEEAARKAEEEKAAKEANGGKEEAGSKPETTVARAGDEGKKQEGEAVEAAAVGPVEIEKDADAIALAEAEADAAAVVMAEKAPEEKTAAVTGEDGKPVGEEKTAPVGRKASIVSYDWPDRLDVEVPLNTIFPFTALQAQLDAMSSGSLQRSFTVFDGTSPNGAFRVLYRPVRAISIAAIKPKGSIELLEPKSFRYSATYLNTDSKSTKPVRIEITQTHENGVISEMVIDFGALSIKADLGWIKGTTAPVCE